MNVRLHTFLLSLSFLFCSFSLRAQTNDLANRQARDIEILLMAPCCWGSTIAEHNSDIAMQMKGEVRTFLSEGKTEQQILDHFEAQYGERILARPKTGGFNLLVWWIPILGGTLGLGLLVLFMRRWQRGQSNEVPEVEFSLDPKYQRQIDRELYGELPEHPPARV